ncbi:NAD binding domain of 6-phosphogluconate dehydrogenase-domain-containing protein [Massariosphaeria phaeospora]|uniref:NAD binding domain of 6-phosphogluconate dehydrogenase-domain-containing protein n=1 Tax=Massariosphaeria phaeospora TaxID=100035 RepID=A0A7C8I114_9PLEO|nr:NAD binding domain of 6-phosphogluconate dehydrogenase-domain-containing protein [Massariosphaeria phaeospora]
MSTKPAIGFCGLGAMGFGMATHLVKSGYAVTGFDVYAPTLEKFKAAGGIPSTSLSDSAKEKEYYICMVATAQQAQTAIFGDEGILKGLPKGATLLLCSTVPSAYAKSVQKELKDVGREDVLFIDAPVSGGAIRAADGSLSIMAGASPAAFEKGKWLLEELSAPAKLFIVEGGVGAGSNMKMVHQVLAAIHILAVSEAFGFAARLGLNGKDVREAVIESQAWSWMFENRSVRTLGEDYFPGASAVLIIIKDTGIITSMARSLGFSTPLCSIAEQVYFSALDRGWGTNDDAGIVRLWTADPVSNIQTKLSDEDKKAKLDLVINLLSGIHLCAAAESIAFAKHIGLPLPQLYELAIDAAGGSAMFKELGAKMIPILEGKSGESGGDLSALAEKLTSAINEAQAIRCPLYLGNGALNLLAQAGKDVDLGSLLNLYAGR